ncbi:MAG TPA: multidrug DMT transporter permease [Candidatus Atribacteria bacterium]|jgi:drug/metabolite transporter (DMT)-like permease|nr:MAG: Permeases of the drug/metabolite transporter (DMT) superfamily [Atribacteria bacterium 34_128]HAJ32411.1 multidrug DMT transporter permease [Candidatus Atribacteria bacterium]
MKSIQAEIYLLGIVIIWGSTFAIIKNILNLIPPYTFLAYRFLLATLVLMIIFWKKIGGINKIILRKGSLIGTFLFLGYTFQTVGIKYTSATKAGFITGLSVVLVPIISHFFIKEKINRNSVIGVVLAFIGLWFLNYSSSFSFNLGDFLVLLCAVSFALHIISVGLYIKKMDYVLLVIVQLATVFILSLLMAIIFERPAIHLSYPSSVWWAIMLTGVFATALAFYIQNRFQRYSTATKTAIIFSGEPIFGAIFAYLLLGEKVGLIAWAGGLLIIFGMIISQKEEKI